MDFRQEFIEFALAQNVLRFGEFKTKAGRLSPYFFNAGLFDDGLALDRLSHFYAQAILASGIAVDVRARERDGGQNAAPPSPPPTQPVKEVP